MNKDLNPTLNNPTFIQCIVSKKNKGDELYNKKYFFC